MTEYYLNLFKSNIDIDHLIKNLNDKTFMENIKGDFFDFNFSKWKVEKYKNFVRKNKLSYLRCYDILSAFGSKYFKYNQKGKLVYEDFIYRIEKHNLQETDNRILIKTDRIDFYKDLYELSVKHFSKISKTEYFDFIDKNFDSKTSKSNLKKLHRDYAIFEKTSTKNQNN